MIYEFVATIEKKELELWQQGKRISLELLKNTLTTQENNSSFISFSRQEVMNSSLKDSTKRNHLSTLMLLQEFKKNITFSDLTFELISSFEYFLQLKGYHTNTIAKHMKHLKRHVNIAINKEYIEILCGDGKSSEKFWTLEKRIKEDKKDCGVQCEMSRSNQFYIMLSLLNEGAITMEDLEDFSDDLKEIMQHFVRL